MFGRPISNTPVRLLSALVRHWVHAYPFGRSSRSCLLLDLSMIRLCLKDRFRLVVFLVKIWLPWDFEKTNLPVPVFLNRFAAARFVFIFGISMLSSSDDLCKIQCSHGSTKTHMAIRGCVAPKRRWREHSENKPTPPSDKTKSNI